MVEPSGEEEVAEGIGSELHVIPLWGIFVLGGTHCISDAKKDMKGGFLPVVA